VLSFVAPIALPCASLTPFKGRVAGIFDHRSAVRKRQNGWELPHNRATIANLLRRAGSNGRCNTSLIV
jgi:hypothetical protein